MKYNYLFFCSTCGMPNQITPYILHHYISLDSVQMMYCSNCQKEIMIPAYLKKIANELK